MHKAGYTLLTAKLLRIKNAIEKSVNDEVIHSSWKGCGFNIKIRNGVCASVEFTTKFQEWCMCEITASAKEKISQNFMDELKQTGTHEASMSSPGKRIKLPLYPSIPE